MPQLDKVTFLSQFFWLCIVFGFLYLTLVKHFLPFFARIIQVRLSMADSSSDSSEENSIESGTGDSENLQNSLVSSETRFVHFLGYFLGWSWKRGVSILSEVQSYFSSLLTSISTTRFLTESNLLFVVPPIGAPVDRTGVTGSFMEFISANINQNLFGEPESNEAPF